MVNKRCRRKTPVFGPPSFTELFLSGNKFMVRWRILFLPPSLGRSQFQGNFWKLLQSYSNAKHWQWAPFSKFFHFLLVLFASCLGMSSIVALVVITGIKAAAYFHRQAVFPLQLWVGSLTIDTSVLTFNRTSHPSTSLHLDGIQSWCFPLLYFWGGFHLLTNSTCRFCGVLYSARTDLWKSKDEDKYSNISDNQGLCGINPIWPLSKYEFWRNRSWPHPDTFAVFDCLTLVHVGPHKVDFHDVTLVCEDG